MENQRYCVNTYYIQQPRLKKNISGLLLPAEDLLVILLSFLIIIKVFRLKGRPNCYSTVSFSYIYIYFFSNFSKTPGRIFMKFTGMVYTGLERLKIFFRVMTSLPVWDIDDFLIFKVLFCSEIFSESTQDIFFKFPRIIDKGLMFVPFESQVSSSKSVEAR